MDTLSLSLSLQGHSVKYRASLKSADLGIVHVKMNYELDLFEVNVNWVCQAPK